MSPLSVRCIKAAFVFLAIGIGLGVVFAFDRSIGARLRPLHAELNLWGWVTLLIYGMGYHMFPRFAGRPLEWPRLAVVQSWLAIAGVTLTAVGWWGLYWSAPLARAVLIGGGFAQAIAALLFALLIGTSVVRVVPTS